MLSQYLSRVSLEFIRRSLSYDMPPEVVYLVNAIIDSAKRITESITDFNIDTYINDLVEAEHIKQKSQLTINEFKYEMLHNFYLI